MYHMAKALSSAFQWTPEAPRHLLECFMEGTGPIPKDSFPFKIDLDLSTKDKQQKKQTVENPPPKTVLRLF